ncbi:MAG TPA: phosphate ABC transporter substrate-binding protein PstS [Streptosporangiaceae bacterium]|nr:phosphate ABC transporter substrate-binding protein PstS [Streptosporangiaceae bacterium]
MTVGGAIVAMALSLAACSSSSSSSPATGSSGSSAPSSGSSSSSAALSGTLNGSGSSFQNTFQEAAIQGFKAVQSGITVNYNSVGSGTGRSNLAAGTVNFAGSDSPIPAKEASEFAGKTVLYFPVVIGPITLSYNLSGVSNLKLDPTVIAKIFQGDITKWNDPAIAADNPGVNLPSTAITTAVRSDSSGTTQNFSLFLQTAVPSVWKLGSSSTIKWPASARAGAQNTGVASIIKSTSGAIGYVDYSTAKASGLTYASIKNSAGNYVAPSPSGASVSAAGVNVKPDLTFAAVWGSGAQAYPITYQSWVLVYATQPNASDASMLQAYLTYLLGDGQQLLSNLGYAPLPSNIDTMAKAQISKITG